MERKIKGIALLLFSILLTLGFDAMDWTWFRFAFFEMPPAFNNPQFSEYLSSTSNPALQALAQAVDHLNREIADDPSFGSGFRIGHSYFCLGKHVSNEDVADIIDFELEPLIREYWFDAPDTAENKIADLKAVL